ncbi:TonB family protein [Massilia sp. TN1-12]|uniref:TonB family protein n=1 Tax=Massilia paldalensis TaxID=3377675 RepID=UPI00384F053D
MKTSLALLAAVATLLPAGAGAARLQDPQDVMVIDLNACYRPSYPAAALASGAGGKTTVEVRIGVDGRVAEARIAASSGRTDLDEAALAGIRACPFPAVLANGQVPTGWLKTQYVWIPGATKKKDVPDQALYASTSARAMAGDAAAQYQLGAWLERGTYGTTDLAQAAGWYRQAAEGGNAAAQNSLGMLYGRGAGVPYDPRQAADWYARAAEQGHGWAQMHLAGMYETGTAGEQDHDKALYWMRKSAEGGLPFAQLGLGLLLMQHAASDAERTAAAAWLARAADQHQAFADYYLGRTFELGLGNVQDDARAAALYRKAADTTDGRADTALGMLVEAGRAGPADQEQAAALYRKAMQARYPAAFYRYGLLLEQRGDDQLATAVYFQGAQLGDCDAARKYVQARRTEGGSDEISVGIFRDRAARACTSSPAPPPVL